MAEERCKLTWSSCRASRCDSPGWLSWFILFMTLVHVAGQVEAIKKQLDANSPPRPQAQAVAR